MGLLGGSAGAAVLFQACGVPEDELVVQSPVEMPEDLVSGLDNWYATICRQCPGDEGIVVRVMEGRAKKVEGNIDYPVNRGKHSARCEAALQGLYDPDRIEGPLLRRGERGDGQWEQISWTRAVAMLADQLGRVENRSQVVAVTNPIGGHLGLVLDRFMNKYGSRSPVAYEPLENTVLRAAMKQVFDQHVMPDFDLERTEYLLSFGADFLDTWVSPVRYARGYGRFRQGDRTRGTMVHVGPRFSMTAANADEWLYVRPGQEGLLALSMAQVIISEGLGHENAAAALTGDGAPDLDQFAPEKIAGDLSGDVAGDRHTYADRVKRIARDFATHGPSLAIGGGSASAHTNGLSNLVSIYSLNHLAGSVGEPGGIVFNPDSPLKGVKASPNISGFGEMQGLINDMNDDGIKLMMLREADPMYALSDLAGFRQASYKVPFIASFSGRMDDTTAMADLVLPGHHPLEDWGTEVPEPGPGYQTVGLQQPVVRPFFESKGIHLGTKSFGDVLLALAQVLELELGLQDNMKGIMEDGVRELFEKGEGSVTAPTFQSFWNGILQRGGWWDTSAKYKGVVPGPRTLKGTGKKPSFGARTSVTRQFHLVPFASSSLTDGRGAHLPWLQATPDPLTTATWRTWLEINDKKASEMDIKEGDVVRVESDHGSIEVLAYPHPAVSPEVVCIPFGQGHTEGGRFSKGRGSNVFSILAPLIDEDTGALAWAGTQVSVDKTGEWVRVPKFENTAPDLAVDEDHHIIQITGTDT